MLRILGLVKPLRLLTTLPYSLFLSLSSPGPADSYSAVLPLRAAFTPVCNSPPLVSRLRLTICSRGNGVPGVPARWLFWLPGTSFSRLKLLCRLLLIASPSRPAACCARAFGSRERSGAPERECACRCSSEDEASRDAGRAVEGRAVVVGEARAAKEVLERARTGVFEPRGADCGVVLGSSTRSHIELED